MATGTSEGTMLGRRRHRRPGCISRMTNCASARDGPHRRVRPRARAGTYRRVRRLPAPRRRACAFRRSPRVVTAARIVIREGHAAPAGTSRDGHRFMPGDTLGDRYRLEQLIGEGGMGAVWRAKDLLSLRVFALKILKPSGQDAARRFLREARVMASLRHPNVVTLYEAFAIPETSTPVLVLELLEGQTLAARLAARRRGSPSSRRRRSSYRWCVRLELHALGIVHRDLKPANVFLVRSASESTLRVKVLDFGLAKVIAESGDIAASGALAETGHLIGTPQYMAPEQIAATRDVDHRADVWAVGVMAYECLAGCRPIDGAGLRELFLAIAKHKIVPIEKRVNAVPRHLSNIVGRMLSRTPDKRPALREVEDAFNRTGKEAER